MGRRALTLSEAQLAEVETLAAILSAGQIADYFGIGRTTFFAMIRRDEVIAERYKRGKARAIGAIAQSLITKARAGDTASMIFYLKTQAGWRETLQVEASDEWSRTLSDPTQWSDEDLARVIGTIEHALAAVPAEDTTPEAEERLQ
jgi:hypothetical protein